MNKKIEQAIRLIQSAGRDGMEVEVAYSGGKDSDVILELTRMAGIKYRAIYKNTTIDPPYTIVHAKENGAEVRQPQYRFFDLIARNGFPNRFYRHCCRYLKEYKVLDRSVMGVRRAESTKRAARYSEPTECRFYGSKREHVEAYYPILDWSDQDIVDFIMGRGVKLHPLYYRDDGSIDPKRRLGCMCCPLKSYRKRIADFSEHPNMVKAYIRAGRKFLDAHPSSNTAIRYNNVYAWFYRDVLCRNQSDYDSTRYGLFGELDYKKYIEDYFHIDLSFSKSP